MFFSFQFRFKNYSADAAFTFTDSAITATGESSGYEIDGTHLTIEASGTYLLSGECSDGSVEVKKGTTGVTLILDGLELMSSDTAPISCCKSTEAAILAAEGSVNTLSDSEKNNGDEYPDNENAENAVIKCKDGSQVTICGTGTLNITANGKNGIKSGATTDEEGEASLIIKELTLNISAPVNDAINAQQLLSIESGTLSIAAGDDTVHSDLVLNIGSEGTEGPTISIAECCEGLEAAELNVLSGDITILSSDDCMNAANSDLGNYDFVINISGGSITAYSTEGDGFDSNGMGVSISAKQPYVTFGSSGGMGSGSSLISKGDVISVKDSDGNELYSGAASCDAVYVFFSSAELGDGGSYSLYAGSESAATATAQAGTSSSGGTQPGARPGGNMGDMQPPSGEPGGQKPDGEPPAKPE